MDDTKPHFNDDAWVSFVRDVLPERLRMEMRRHLDCPCAECKRAHQRWKRFLEIAVRPAPESAARIVMEARARKDSFSAGIVVLAEQMFDSLRDPLPAGIRAGAPSTRRLLYEAGGYLIDLLLEQSGAGNGTITGQVAQAWIEGAGGGAAVVLVREGVVQGQIVTNSIGEFQLACGSWNNLKICVGIPDGTSIEVPLPDLNKTVSSTGGAT